MVATASDLAISEYSNGFVAAQPVLASANPAAIESQDLSEIDKETVATSLPPVSLELELDPYYSNVSLYVPLTSKPIVELELSNESKIYLSLLRNALSPRFFLVEISVNPLPVLGTYLKDQHRDEFDKADVNDELNLIQVFTEGFEEPYALSFFLGNVIQFKTAQQKDTNVVNRGFSGFLYSMGDKHIKNSVLIDDNWYELEWKLKGDRQINQIIHSWSFRFGIKEHQNTDITDVFYLGIRRELFNQKPGSYDWLDNTGIDYRISFARDNQSVAQQHIFVEKKWPGKASSFSLGLGLNKNTDKYRGALADKGDEIKLIVRPGVRF